MLTFVKTRVGAARSWWWDFIHNVETRIDVELAELTTSGSAKADCARYMPTSPVLIRRAVEALSIRDLSAYTFVDFGAGKGRALLSAARFPFAEVVGVEFAAELHQQCLRNVSGFRGGLRSRVTPLHMDATEYSLPRTPCVLFFYFPFRKPVMTRVLENIGASLREFPRDVAVIHQAEWPWVSELMTAHEFRIATEDPYFKIYRRLPAANSE